MEEKKLRRGTVQYASRTVNSRYASYHGAKDYVYFPRINISGNWLEDLGFHIGDEVTVECEKGCLCIRLKQQEPEIIQTQTVRPQLRAVCDGGGGYMVKEKKKKTTRRSGNKTKEGRD